MDDDSGGQFHRVVHPVLAVLFWLGVARMWHIYVLLACRSIGSAFHTPAMQASVPLLAPKQQLTRLSLIHI